VSQFCPKCGTKNIDEAKFCKNCGFNLLEASNELKKTNTYRTNEQSPSSLAAEQTKPDKEADAFIYIALVAGIFLFVILWSIIEYPEYKLKSLKQDAENGNNIAQYDLGMLYEKGEQGLSIDYAEAAIWFKKAAEDGHEKATDELCFLYLDKKVQTPNNAEIVDYCNDTYSSANDLKRKQEIAEKIADIYFNDANFKNSKIWYQNVLESMTSQSSKSNFANKLGDKYFDNKNFKTSEYWYQKSVDLGGEDAKFRLAYLLSERKQYNLAIKYYKESLKFNNWEGTMGKLAGVYSDKKDYKNAILWYEKAVNNGNKDVYFGYGYAYDMIGNTTKAIELYKKSALFDKESAAMYNLGITYKNLQDYQNAEYWYKEAVKHGDKDANKALQNLISQGLI
jgi:TPR repeat protein